MNISGPFIARPVATTLLAAALFLVGLLGYSQLKVSALPEVDFPTIEVTTQLPGASPDTAAVLLTAPLERQFAQISGLSTMSSTSGPGVSRITLQFDLDKKIDDAAQDVQAAINAADATLPDDLPYPPTYFKVNPADPAVVTIALTSDTLPVDRLSESADTLIAQKLSQVSGVGRVTVQGNMRPAVRLRLDPERLAAYGIDIDTARTAIAAANVNSAKGSFDGARQGSTIMANDQMASAADYANIVIAWKNNAAVRLHDVGEAVEALENDRNGAWYNNTPAVLVDVQRQPGANIVDTVESIRARLPEIQAAIPAGIKLDVVADRTETIRASVHEVQFTLVLSIALVVGVIFLFLPTARATLVPAVSLPISIIGTFAAMYAMGYSLDNLSLMALTIATGFVVDDAIVMIENIVRLIEKGEKPLKAAFEGARQIGFTIISLTLSLIAVFIPLLFMSGVVGRLFREFAETLTAAVLVSMLVSLTLTPMMCGLLLRSTEEDKPGRIARASERVFDRFRDAYASALSWTMAHHALTLAVAGLTLIATIAIYVVVPKGFLPAQDTGMIQITTEGPQDASFARMNELQAKVAEIVRADPAVVSVMSITGSGTVNSTTNAGRITAVLKQRGERDGAQAIIARLKPKLATVPGMVSWPVAVQDIQLSAQLSTTQYQYTLTDSDDATLSAWMPNLLEALAKLPQLRDIASDQHDEGMRIMVQVNRDKATRLGVTMSEIDSALYSAFGQRQITTIYTQSNQYRVVLEAGGRMKGDATALGRLRLPGTDNALVPLAEVARITTTTGPLVVTREKQFPSATISFNTADGVSLGQAVDAITQVEQQIGMPASMTGRFTGDVAEFNSSVASIPFLIFAAVVAIYIVLGVLYESLIHPLTILSTLPSAGIGALLALRIFDLDLSVVALIGIILLMGIVKKNAIMMIDFALEAQRDENLPPHEAIYRACLMRFRPIMMTTLAALLGALPLVISQGMGSELRIPLGVSIIGGLLLSQVVTLFTTPAIYLAMEDLRARYWGGPGKTVQAH
ncbi:multidrug resistance protein MdtB [Roseomonas sp. TAS13]|uniref:efflux RND transporter permease subunit n=1 Tax=Roseomonas sp. TAS13 TaxID=1926319 RepID=UPI00096824C1|nr:efflux RND transporter permease subunit [Roseomonas sp. TAS13]USQ74207.1 efflux RND transporter permease subunit [Roseomonas mucosa]GAV34590.1 multidrug resistance protein MdtB [Roseomonas sp. TAS13]